MKKNDFEQLYAAKFDINININDIRLIVNICDRRNIENYFSKEVGKIFKDITILMNKNNSNVKFYFV